MSGLKTEKAKSGGGKPPELPPEGKYKAAIVAIVDLGTQMVSFQGEEAKPKHQLFVAWELDSAKAKQSNGSPFIMGDVFTFSTHKKAGFRALWEAHLGTIRKEEDIVGQDPERLLATACVMKIVHADNGKDGEERRTYANIAYPLMELSDDELIGKPVKTVNLPFLWDLTNPHDYADHDWLPFVYDRSAGKRIPLSEMIDKSAERAAGRKAGRATAGAANGSGGGEAF